VGQCTARRGSLAGSRSRAVRGFDRLVGCSIDVVDVVVDRTCEMVRRTGEAEVTGVEVVPR
jgi:hypothetical protein